MPKVTLELSEEAIKKATELFDWEFNTDEMCPEGGLPASKEWAEFKRAWENRQLDLLVLQHISRKS